MGLASPLVRQMGGIFHPMASRSSPSLSPFYAMTEGRKHVRSATSLPHHGTSHRTLYLTALTTEAKYSNYLLTSYSLHFHKMIERLIAEETGRLSILRRLWLTGRAFSFADSIR